MTDKTWQLIQDNPQPFCREISGVKVWFKPLTNGQRIHLLSKFQKIDSDANAYDELIALTGKFIDKIELAGQEGQSPETILPKIFDITIQIEIIKAALESSALTGDESKNLPSSSVG